MTEAANESGPALRDALELRPPLFRVRGWPDLETLTALRGEAIDPDKLA